MQEILDLIKGQLVWATGEWFEYVAVLAGVAYVVFAAARSIWCWLMGFISSAIYVAIMINADLYMDALLYLYYTLMAVYGFWVWKFGAVPQSAEKSDELPVTVWSWKVHLIAGILLSFTAYGCGYWLSKNTEADFPYWDSFTTCFAFFATFLVTRKVLENWIYWVILDVIWAVIYFHKGYQATTGLMIFYTIFAIYGFINWYRSWRLLARPV